MKDQSTDFACFLRTEYLDIPEPDRPAAVRTRFPRISYKEFMRGFAIAEETHIQDGLEALIAA